MKLWWIFFGVGSLIILVGSYVYTDTGVREYWRVKEAIDKLAVTDKNEAQQSWERFAGEGQERVYGGILGGTWFDRVLVWGASGLRMFRVDEYSVYSWYDGCQPQTLARLNAGEAGIIEREIYTNFATWQQKARTGDYVRVYETGPAMGGTVGNLREIYTYNFWLFMNWRVEERCVL